MKTHCGSLEYAAPELIANNDNKYGPEVDIWSL
jgi:serine/threonine protein kinase